MSVSNLEQNETVKDALKTILTEMAEEYETSYNFGGQLTFSETDILDFPRMFAKMGGKKWKASKDECTLLINLLLEHYSLDHSIYYMNGRRFQ